MAAVPAVHVLVVLWGFAEILLFGGVIFGWHSLVYVYKDENYFAENCDAGNTSILQTDNGSSVLWASVWNNSTEKIPAQRHWSNVTDSVSISPWSELTCEEKLQQTSSSMSSQTCASQDEQFSLVFSLSTVITGLLCVLNGYLYDHFGTRFCRCLSILCYIISWICLIAASPDNGALLYPGFILLAYAGYIILVTNMQLAGLIPRFRSTLISMCSGSFDSSAAVFLLFKIAHEAGIKVNHCFAFQMGLFIIIIISTFLVHKKSRFPWPLPPHFKFQFSVCKCSDKKRNERLENKESEFNWSLNENGSMVNFHLSENDFSTKNPLVLEEKDLANLLEKSEFKIPQEVTELNNAKYSPPKIPSLLEIIKTPLFLWNLSWMCFQRLRSWFFVGMFNPWITRLACGDKSQVSHYTSFFAMIQFIGVFTSPLSGRLMDRKMPAAKVYNNPRYERLHASIASFVMCSTMGLVFSILVAIPVIQIQYVSCILHSLCRSFIYGPNFAFAANAYPIEHFGKVTGVILTVSAVFGMLQYPLFLLIQGPLNNNPLVVDILFIVMMLLSFCHPFYIWNFLRKEKQKITKDKHQSRN